MGSDAEFPLDVVRDYSIDYGIQCSSPRTAVLRQMCIFRFCHMRLLIRTYNADDGIVSRGEGVHALEGEISADNSGRPCRWIRVDTVACNVTGLAK
jgi:hypothetical protein